MSIFLFTCMLCGLVSCAVFTSCANSSNKIQPTVDTVLVDSMDTVVCDSAVCDSAFTDSLSIK